MTFLGIVSSICPVNSAPDNSNWYPANITPPAGLQFHCDLRPLPSSMTGIPASDRVFINHTYAMIIKAIHAELAMIRALQTQGSSATEYARYYATTKDAVTKITAEKAPTGLEPFKQNIISALAYQMNFYAKANAAKSRGQTWQEMTASIPEGRSASGQLFAAWDKMQSRYPGWTSDTKDSIYHHLCALDIF